MENEKKMTADEIIAETVKIIGMIEIPVCLQKIAAVLNGCISNLNIACEMVKKEHEMANAQNNSESEAEVIEDEQPDVE